MADAVIIRVLIDDGTPRLPLAFRIQLSVSVLRFKHMIEAQEGFGVSEQELFFQGNQLLDNLTLGQQGVVDGSHLDLSVNFQGQYVDVLRKEMRVGYVNYLIRFPNTITTADVMFGCPYDEQIILLITMEEKESVESELE